MNFELSKNDGVEVLKVMKQWQEVASTPITKGQKDSLRTFFGNFGFTDIQVNDDGTVDATFKGDPELLNRYEIALGKPEKGQKVYRYTGLQVTSGGFEYVGGASIMQDCDVESS